jgi:ABC-type transport system involved in multi-copper enzyme maturation permease subunit
MSSFKQAITLALRSPNPLLLRDLRASARLGFKPWVLLVLIVVSTMFMTVAGSLGATATMPAQVGEGLFHVYFTCMIGLVTLVAPATAAGAIAMEREGKTWEALLLTGLTPRQITRGKFLAALSDVGIYVVALAPVGALCFVFGGVGAFEVVVAYIFILVHTILCICFGLAISSVVRSTRTAVLLSIIIAVLIGGFVFPVMSFAFSAFAHELWPAVKSGLPVWYPAALARADFGAPYVAVLIAGPLAFYGIPSLMLYEHAAANVADPMDDRSSGIKRWYLASCIVLVALCCAIPFIFPYGGTDRRPLVFVGEAVLILFLFYCALLLAGEPVQAPRRVRIAWARAGASTWTQFLGPNLIGTTKLIMGTAIFGFLVTCAVGVFAVRAHADTGTGQAIGVIALYTVCFFVFICGLLVWLRSRNMGAWPARFVTIGIITLVSIAPWAVYLIVLAANTGAPTPYAIACLSPFYVIPFAGAAANDSSFRSAANGGQTGILLAGAVASFLYAMCGLVMLASASAKARAFIRDARDREAAEDVHFGRG